MDIKPKVLMIGDCLNWAIDRLVYPLVQRDSNINIVYHFTDEKPKRTGFNKDKQKKLTIDDFDKDYDIFHFHCLRAGLVSLHTGDILKKIGNRKIVFTVHTEREEDLQLLINTDINIDKVIAPTRYIYNKLKDKFETIIIPHCIEIEKFPYIETITGKEVGYIGRIVPHKRFKELVEACRDKYEVDGIGYIDDSTYWRSIYPGGFNFSINIDQSTMVDHIKKHFKIFTCLSEPNIEAGPLPVLECAALGIPILTTDVGWAKDNLHKHQAYFINQSDIRNLLEYIEFLFMTPNYCEEMRLKARKLVENFNMNWYLDKHREIYNE
jgi:glycosyltransferase involved in cell wall biosynthesis